MIRLPPEHYDLFAAACEITSPEYTILKNNIARQAPKQRRAADGRDHV